MNLFILSLIPTEAAEAYMDKHVSKILLEAVQMLCTAMHVLVPDTPIKDDLYKQAHLNHPVSIWVRTSRDNFIWTLDLVEALHEAHPSKQYMSWEFQDEYSFEQMYEEGDLVAEGVGTGCLKHVFEQTDPIWVGLYWDFEADSGAMEAFAEADWDEFLDVLDDLRVAVQKLSCAEAEYVELRDSCDEDYDDY